MFHWLDKIEIFLVKCFLILAVAVVLCQLIIRHPSMSEVVVLLDRLEGVVYTYGGIQ